MIWSVWWFQILWKIWTSIGMMTFPRYGKIKHVPNHHPDNNPSENFIQNHNDGLSWIMGYNSKKKLSESIHRWFLHRSNRWFFGDVFWGQVDALISHYPRSAMFVAAGLLLSDCQFSLFWSRDTSSYKSLQDGATWARNWWRKRRPEPSQ